MTDTDTLVIKDEVVEETVLVPPPAVRMTAEQRQAFVATAFALIRQVIVFVLGVALIITAVIQSGTQNWELVTGLILIVLAPLDGLVSWLLRRG